MKTLISFTLALIWLLVLPRAEGRPESIPKSTMEHGCIPGHHYMCPVGMYCLVDPNYARVGQCLCLGAHGKLMTAPRDFGKELAPSKSRIDCKAYAPHAMPSTLWHVMIGILFFRVSIGAALLMQRVFKNGGAKWNTSYIWLLMLCLAGIGDGGRSFSYVLSRYPMFDKDWKLMYITGKWFVVLPDSLSFAFRYEIITTWFDLYQKSVKMTKRSSIVVVAARTLFRLFALFAFVFSVLQASGIVPVEIKNNMIAFGFGPIILLTCWVIGPLLTRLLCKDMRDVSNPNWNAALAIRRIAYFEPLCHMATILGVAVSNKTLLYTHMAGIHTLAALMPMMAYWLTSIGEWFSYVIFTHRRFLKDNDTIKYQSILWVYNSGSQRIHY